jgi:site-specific recombinase XerD
MAGVSFDWRRVVEIWKESGRTPATIALYACWARRFVAYCRARGKSPIECLRRRDVEQAIARGRNRYGGRGWGGGRCAFSATRALSCALAALGHKVPVWEDPPRRAHLAPILREFVEHRLRHRGVSALTARRDATHAALFTSFLHDRKRRVDGVRLVDVDEFIMRCAAHWTPKTVAGVCSTLRAFLRFAHASGRLRFDLASSVLAPRVRSMDRPRRVLPWNDVRRILHGIDVTRAPGRRYFAVILMMAAYGMGAAEVTGLVLEDLDWSARTVRVRRPKTGSTTVLPLLDPVARALARYIRHERPAHGCGRSVFLSHHLPHVRLSCSAVRYAFRQYATLGGVKAPFRGAHVLRHTHATRQVEAGAPMKIVGDILGHQRPSSTSVYVRGAIFRLRAVALPVPR